MATSSARQQPGVNPITGSGYAPSPKTERPGKKVISGRNDHSTVFNAIDSPLRFQTTNVMSAANPTGNLGKWADDLVKARSSPDATLTAPTSRPKASSYDFIVRTGTVPGHYSFSTHNTHTSGACRVVSEKGDTVVLNLFFTNANGISSPQQVTFVGGELQHGANITVKIPSGKPLKELEHGDHFTVTSEGY